MANLTTPSPRQFAVNPDFMDYPIGTSKIYEGSAVSDAGSPSAGTNVANTLVAGENFLGFADQTVDNTSGASGVTISVATKGYVQLVVTGVTSASLGATVYASDGNTFTLTSTSNSKIGKVAKIVSGTTVLVAFYGLAVEPE